MKFLSLYIDLVFCRFNPKSQMTHRSDVNLRAEHFPMWLCSSSHSKQLWDYNYRSLNEPDEMETNGQNKVTYLTCVRVCVRARVCVFSGMFKQRTPIKSSRCFSIRRLLVSFLFPGGRSSNGEEACPLGSEWLKAAAMVWSGAHFLSKWAWSLHWLFLTGILFIHVETIQHSKC